MSRLLLSSTLRVIGTAMPARTTMMATTTSISTSVKAAREDRRLGVGRIMGNTSARYGVLTSTRKFYRSGD